MPLRKIGIELSCHEWIGEGAVKVDDGEIDCAMYRKLDVQTGGQLRRRRAVISSRWRWLLRFPRLALFLCATERVIIRSSCCSSLSELLCVCDKRLQVGP